MFVLLAQGKLLEAGGRIADLLFEIRAGALLVGVGETWGTVTSSTPVAASIQDSGRQMQSFFWFGAYIVLKALCYLTIEMRSPWHLVWKFLTTGRNICSFLPNMSSLLVLVGHTPAALLSLSL